MAGMTLGGFPLAGLPRRLAEAHYEQAHEHLIAAENDVRALLAGDERSGTFKADTDPVELLIWAARQAELCDTVLKLDDESKAVSD